MARTKRNPRIAALKKLQTRAIRNAEIARDAAFAGVNQARARTAEMMTQLEHAFEERVQKAASRLGVASAAEVRALSRQVAELKASVGKARRARA
jgi:poly(hydroxyalkanoate) granule-associated protein